MTDVCNKCGWKLQFKVGPNFLECPICISLLKIEIDEVYADRIKLICYMINEYSEKYKNGLITFQEYKDRLKELHE